MEWRDIESAPRDGTDVLLAFEPPWTGDRWMMAVGYWHDEQDLFEVSWGGAEIENAPTHWMPLPEPPPL